MVCKMKTPLKTFENTFCVCKGPIALSGFVVVRWSIYSLLIAEVAVAQQLFQTILNGRCGSWLQHDCFTFVFECLACVVYSPVFVLRRCASL